MQPLRIGIELDQNTDFNLVVTLSNTSGPIDITGYQFKSQMRPTTDPSIVPPTAEFIFTILNQTTNKGQVKWFLPAASDDEDTIPLSKATALVVPRQLTPFLFDVKMKDTLNQISRIVEGIIYISPEATLEDFT